MTFHYYIFIKLNINNGWISILDIKKTTMYAFLWWHNYVKWQVQVVTRHIIAWHPGTLMIKYQGTLYILFKLKTVFKVSAQANGNNDKKWNTL